VQKVGGNTNTTLVTRTTLCVLWLSYIPSLTELQHTLQVQHSICCQWREEDIHIRKTRSSLNAGGFSFASFNTFPDLFRTLNVHFQNGDTCKHWSPGFLLNNPN